MTHRNRFIFVFFFTLAIWTPIAKAGDIKNPDICRMGFLQEWPAIISDRRLIDVWGKFTDIFRPYHRNERGGIIDFAGYDDCLYITGNRGCGPLRDTLTQVKREYNAKLTSAEKHYAPEFILMSHAKLKAHTCCLQRHSPEACVKGKGLVLPAE